MAITFNQPAAGSRFEIGEEVTFGGTAGAGVAQVNLDADGILLGTAPVDGQGHWTFLRSFSGPGNRTIHAVAGQQSGKLLIEIGSSSDLLRTKMVKLALSQNNLVGDGSHRGAQIRKFFDYCGFQEGIDWCVMFCNWVYHQASSMDPPYGKSTAFVPTVAAWAKHHDRWVREHDPHDTSIPRGNPLPGDLLIVGDGIQLDSKNNYPHIGIVTSSSQNSVQTMEGNHFNRLLRRGDASGPGSHDRNATLNNPEDSLGRYIAGYVRLF